MEENTYAASVFVQTSADAALAYLSDLSNLEHWTLGTRVHEQIDATTWVGSVTSSRDPVYFHLHEAAQFPVPTFEWQVGRSPGCYSAVHRWLIIPASLAHPGFDSGGVYLHWLSFSNPARRTVLANLGYDRTVHQTELRHLKAVLERAQGLSSAACASHRLCAASLYVDAPAAIIGEYLGALTNLPQTMRMWRQSATAPGDLPAATASATFTDAYLRPVRATAQLFADTALALVTLQLAARTALPADSTTTTAAATILSAILPCAHVFGAPDASGCVLHRIAFAPEPEHAGSLHGPHDARDLFAESLSIKRHVELLAGHPDSFAQGYSYPSPAQLRA